MAEQQLKVTLVKSLNGQLQNIAAYNKRATGEKYLINPNKGG